MSFLKLKTKKFLRSEHDISGDPIYPSGQVQTGLCLMTLQFALGAQTCGSAHGFTHFLAWHAV